MKTILTVLITLLLTVTAIAQQGINYKAVIKDNSGNVVANQSVDIQFTILKGTAQTSVYQEIHAPTTDANGIVIVNIGEGTPSQGTFSDIDWDSDDHFLNVKINTGSGLTDMGTTQFKAVPYALQAKSATFETKDGITSNVPGDISMDNFVFGSSQLDHSLAINEIDSRMFFNKEKKAFRAGATISNEWNNDNIGEFSFAVGAGTKASGAGSSAFGTTSIASGIASTAIGESAVATEYGATSIGQQTTASGSSATAIGYYATATNTGAAAFGILSNASGYASLAIGYFTKAESYASTALGYYNVGGGNPDEWIETDPLFEIGNGYLGSSNALTIFKNGSIIAPSYDIAEITDDKALVTKEYVDNLTTINIERTISISASGFNPSSNTSTFTINSGTIAYFSSGNSNVFAPIILPEGAIVKEIKAYILDGDASNNLEFSVEFTANLGGQIPSTLFALSTNNSSSGMQVLTYSPDFTISADNHYFLNIHPSTGNSWSGSNLAIAQVKITYSEQ